MCWWHLVLVVAVYSLVSRMKLILVVICGCNYDSGGEEANDCEQFQDCLCTVHDLLKEGPETVHAC